MKKIIPFLLLAFLSCGDGDLQIEILDFDSVNPQNCETLTIETNLFFKINNDNEALILELPSGLLKNEATTEDIVSTVPSQSKLTYRIFSDKVSSSYFCDDVPPVKPIVTEEIEAASGEVVITTIANADNTFTHQIRLSNITLLTGSSQRITDLTINEFGDIITKE